MGAGAIAAGWLADRLFGDPERRHPVAAFGSVAGLLERRIWRPSRSAGALYALCLICPVASGVAWVERRLVAHRLCRAALGSLIVWASLGGRSLERAAATLGDALDAGELERARELARSLVGRDPSELDAGELCRAAVESVAENTSDAVVAPLLWAALLGAPGVAGYRALNTLDAMVGYRSDRYRRFGWAAARADDLANWPAARLSALLAIAWAPALSGRRADAWHAAWIDGAAHPSPNAGRVEGSFAGALSLTLGGVNRYPHGSEHRPRLGSGEPPAVADIARCILLARLVGASAAVLCAALGRAAHR